jgi:opacity protein-like surface antigen
VSPLRRALRRRSRPVPPLAVAIACWGASTTSASRASADPAKTSLAQNYELGEIQTPRAMAMGGNLYALGTSTTGLYQNPGQLPLARMYHLEANASFAPEAGRQSYGGAIVDSMTSKIAGGVAYAWTQMDPEGVRREWHDLRLSLAYPFTDRIALGVTGRYLHTDQPIARGPFGVSLASDGTPKGPLFNNVTFDVGLALALSDNFHLGVVGKNLTNPGNGVAPTLAGGGIGFTMKDVSIEIDGLADFTSWGTPKPRISGGVEVFLLDRVALRAGYRYDGGVNVHALTFGLGYVDRKWSIEAGGRRDLSGPTPTTYIGIGLRFFYDGVQAATDGEGS